HLAAPAPRRVIAVERLIPLVVVPLSGRNEGRPIMRVGRERDAEVAHVLRCHAPRRQVPELWGDVSLPQVGGLHDVHIAVEHPKPILGHCRPPFCYARLSSNTPTARRSSPRCYLDRGRSPA